MAIIPSKVKLTKNVAGVLNAIRYGIGGDYAAGVPKAENTTESIRAVGAAILAQQSRQNAFVAALINRIGFEIIKSKQYQNPWAMFKKGFLEYGETVEEIFVNLCQVKGYAPEDAPIDNFKRHNPNVSTAFHAMNFQVMYPMTISNMQLHQAFLTLGSLDKFFNGCIAAMYSAMNYDEFLIMKYLIARLALDGKLPVKQIATPSSATSNAIMTDVKQISNDFEFMSDEFTISGNKNFVLKDDQYLIEQTGLNAVLDVNTLASAFNLDKAEFAGHVVLVDSLGKIDAKRLAQLLDKDETYVPFTPTEIEALGKVRGVLCARDFLMVYDILQTMEDAKVGAGLYWNYFLHKWQTVSASPFENVCLLTDAVSTVTNVTVALDSATMSAAGQTGATATVTRTGFASDEVIWSIASNADPEHVEIDAYGIITVKAGYDTGAYTIKATSRADGSVSGTATLTLS